MKKLNMLFKCWMIEIAKAKCKVMPLNYHVHMLNDF
jgi:hypothetical protein